MIKVTDFKGISSSTVPNTYGYFSLGCIQSPSNSTWFTLYKGFSCYCTVEGDKFLVFLYKIGLTDSFLVLSDFSKIPDMAVIENELILEVLRDSLINYINETTLPTSELTYLDSLDRQSKNIVYAPYIPAQTNTSFISTQYADANTINSLSTASLPICKG